MLIRMYHANLKLKIICYSNLDTLSSICFSCATILPVAVLQVEWNTRADDVGS